MSDPIEQFRGALNGRGIVPPPELLADGKIHRCDVDGRRGRGDGAYLLHADGIPAGGFENWRDGLGWQNWRADLGPALAPAEQEANRARIEVEKREREADEAKRRSEARDRATQLWMGAGECIEHDYLTNKRIAPHGARLHGGSLVLPMRDISGALHSLQFIKADGSKKFLTGGRVRGCYFGIGKPEDVLCIVEGFATGASIHEATGYAVAVAFNAWNLLWVAKALREKFPDLPLLLCADDDYCTEGNPGQTKAIEACQAVDGMLIIPYFGDDRPEGATDFNDLHRVHGVEEVRRCIDSALKGSPTTRVLSGACGVDVSTPDVQTEPDEIAGFEYGGGRFEVSADGVFFTGLDARGKELPPRWICSTIAVVAKTRDAKSREWGRLLEWHDDDGVRHQWAMPLELLQGDGSDVRRELARLGLSIAPAKPARDHLSSFLQMSPVESRARCVERLGWHGAVYVTPKESFGQLDEIVVFQNAHALEPAFSAAGTPDEWRDAVAALATGNSRLVFSLSVAFAGPLVDIVGEDSGGFHFRGNSSSGKTTLLKVAASVWGNPRAYNRLWRATANGLEGLAALHNDGVLILDELGQIDPKEAGEAAYLLANGRGKARASRSGAARQSASWRLLFLSAGEESLTGLMARAGRKTSAGQEIRLADIDVDAGAGMGAFEELHNQSSPGSLALAVSDATIRYYGSAGVAWLRAIVADRTRLADFIANGVRKFVEEFGPKDADGQVSRVARRFALVAVAGELATCYGLTGWQEGEATTAASKCFASWLESFGGTENREARAMLAQVRAFFESHGASRFEDMAAQADQRVVNRAGFYRNGDSGKRQFLVLPEAFRHEICRGYDAKAVTKLLIEREWLEPGNDHKTSQKPRIPALGTTTRCYVFNERMWESD